jgi:hypothetical protein
MGLLLATNLEQNIKNPTMYAISSPLTFPPSFPLPDVVWNLMYSQYLDHEEESEMQIRAQLY